jgi:hypothetical protein
MTEPVKVPMRCEQCESLLFEFHDGALAADVATSIDTHLQDCDSCADSLSSIWQMSLVSSRWRDEHTPSWDRKHYFFPRSNWQFPQMLATAASLLALVLVLTDVHFVTGADGIALKSGRSNYVSTASLDAFKADQDVYFGARFQKLTVQQVASNQLMLRSLLDTSQQERREDFTTLVNYWNESQADQYQNTEDSLRYLMASQAEDEKDIRQLTSAFKDIGPRLGSDM